LDDPEHFYLWLKLSLSTDLSWDESYVESEGSVNTPAGKFSGCFKISTSGPGAGGVWYSDEWFKPYVGIVKRYFKSTGIGSAEQTHLLAKYQVL